MADVSSGRMVADILAAQPPQEPSTLQKIANYLVTDSIPAQAVKSAYSGLTSVGDAWDGKIAPEDMQTRAMDAAGMLTLGAGAIPAEANSLRMGVKLMSGAESDPTLTGWTFKDVVGKPQLSAAENRRFNDMVMTPRQEVVPIRSMYATQQTVNPDFAVTESSAGTLPNVVRKDGQLYVYDGHHRLTKVAEEGGQNARVNLYDFDNPESAQTPLLDYDPFRHAAQSAEDQSLLDELFGNQSLSPNVPAPSVGGITAYHGSPATDIETFRTKPWKPAFFSVDEGTPRAEQFAQGFRPDEGGSMYQVNIDPSGVLDARNPEHLQLMRDALDTHAVQGSYPFLEGDPQFQKTGLPGWGDDALYRALGDAGHKGVVLNERPDVRSIAVFDPSIVSIVKKYGIAGALGAGLISATQAAQMQGDPNMKFLDSVVQGNAT